jgi:deoxycytidine triphosphate deaminase/intein/homing endonuclease
MGVLPDWMIERDIKIEPFASQQHRPGVISYGVTSYGYDVRVDRRFKVFTNVWGSTVDPKNFDPKSFVDVDADFCIIPPNSFALAETVEYLEIPRDILCVCVGKCLAGDTRVVDAETGDYLPIREFVARRAAETVAWDGLRVGTAEVSDHIPSGVKPVFRLKTRCGLSVKATAAHPFLTAGGWMPLSALRPGDRMAVARSCPRFGRTEWPEHEALLLGFLTADGQCRTPNSSPRYTTGDPRLAEVFTDAAKAFGCEVSPVGRFGYNLVNHRGRGGIPARNRAYLWLKSLGCDCLSIEKAIPPVVFRAPKASVAAFLRALFSGDGSVYTTTSQIGTHGITLEYASTSERLVRDVRHLLLRFGIFGLVRDRQTASGRRGYRVQICDLGMVRRFAAEIGFVAGSRKQARLEEILAQMADREPVRSTFDTIPASVWGEVRRAAEAHGKSLNGMGVRVMKRQSVPYSFARAVAEATGDRVLREYASADVVWDTVVSIEPAGEEEVFDLAVPGRHNFLADDILVHNSTYARCGIIVNVTPLEPEWRGRVTIEISNTTPLPAKIYAGEGIAQIIFLKAEDVCRTSYADKKGKYQDQAGLTLPFVPGTGPGRGNS